MLRTALREAKRSALLAQRGPALVSLCREFHGAQGAELALISEVERLRISHDLHAMQRRTIPQQAGILHAAVLVPLCHIQGAVRAAQWEQLPQLSSSAWSAACVL